MFLTCLKALQDALPSPESENVALLPLGHISLSLCAHSKNSKDWDDAFVLVLWSPFFGLPPVEQESEEDPKEDESILLFVQSCQQHVPV